MRKKERKRAQKLAEKRRLNQKQAEENAEVKAIQKKSETTVIRRRDYLPITAFPLEAQKTGMQIAETLGEKDPQVLLTIVAMVDAFGVKAIQSFLDDAIRVQGAGGELTDDDSRSRTLGGVFFRIAKDIIGKPLKRLKIWVLKDCSD